MAVRITSHKGFGGSTQKTREVVQFTYLNDSDSDVEYSPTDWTPGKIVTVSNMSNGTIHILTSDDSNTIGFQEYRPVYLSNPGVGEYTRDSEGEYLLITNVDADNTLSSKLSGIEWYNGLYQPSLTSNPIDGDYTYTNDRDLVALDDLTDSEYNQLREFRFDRWNAVYTLTAGNERVLTTFTETSQPVSITSLNTTDNFIQRDGVYIPIAEASDFYRSQLRNGDVRGRYDIKVVPSANGGWIRDASGNYVQALINPLVSTSEFETTDWTGGYRLEYDSDGGNARRIPRLVATRDSDRDRIVYSLEHTGGNTSLVSTWDSDKGQYVYTLNQDSDQFRLVTTVDSDTGEYVYSLVYDSDGYEGRYTLVRDSEAIKGTIRTTLTDSDEKYDIEFVPYINGDWVINEDTRQYVYDPDGSIAGVSRIADLTDQFTRTFTQADNGDWVMDVDGDIKEIDTLTAEQEERLVHFSNGRYDVEFVSVDNVPLSDELTRDTLALSAISNDYYTRDSEGFYIRLDNLTQQQFDDLSYIGYKYGRYELRRTVVGNRGIPFGPGYWDLSEIGGIPITGPVSLTYTEGDALKINTNVLVEFFK